MELSKVSDKYLLFIQSSVQKQINALYKQKKEIEDEISARNDRFEDEYRKGKFQIEMEEEA